MEGDPRHQFDERAAGTAMLGTIFFGAIVGGGIGAFYEFNPVITALIGAVIGIVLGVLLVPRLMRDNL